MSTGPILVAFMVAIGVFGVWAAVMTREAWAHFIAPARARVRQRAGKTFTSMLRRVSHASSGGMPPHKGWSIM